MILKTGVKHKNNKRYKAVLLTVVAILLFISLGVVAYYYSNNAPNTDNIIDGTNFNPPTKDEKNAANTQKEKNLDREQQDATATSKASVFVVDASQYDNIIEIRGYISSVIEDGGKCIATLTNPKYSTVSSNSLGRRDAQTTQCNTITVPRSSFGGAGTWTMTLYYTSPSSSGVSSATKVVIE